MADVELSYKGNTIGSLSASGTLTMETQGKYCEDDITLTYVAPSGGGGTVAGGTVTVTEILHTLEIDTGITPSLFVMVFDIDAATWFPGYKSFSMLSADGTKFKAMGSSNAGTASSTQFSNNTATNSVVFSGTKVTVNANGSSGTVLGSIQPGKWTWFCK